MTPPDVEQRRRALDPGRSFIVQAPAGSGKTELLNQRFLTLLARVEEPEAVLAITFTKKAAAEMRARVVKALRDSVDLRPAEEHAALTWTLARAVRDHGDARGWELSRNPGRLRIRTIDSLCTALASQMPWLSRMGAPPSIDTTPAAHYREAARRTLELLETEAWQADVRALIEHLDNDFAAVANLLAGMLARRDQWLRHVGAVADLDLARRTLEAGFEHAIEDTLVRVRARIPAQFARELAEVAAIAGANLAADEREGAARACIGITALPGADRLDVWLGIADTLLKKDGDWRKSLNATNGFPASAKAAKAQCVELIAALSEDDALRDALDAIRDLPAPRYSEGQWQVLKALIRLLPMAAAQLQVGFRASGKADFCEVSMAAQRALGDADAPTDLALAWDGRIQHLLVDEFQDTSVSQYALIEKLTAGWEPGDGRTLFAVGDPMQSIYRFREAEVGLFLKAAAEGIGSVPLELLRLTANFRSGRPVVEWINEVFPAVLAPSDEIATGAIRYSPADWVHDGGLAPAATLHPYIGRDDASEAARVVELIQAARAREAKKIAILVRSRSHLAAILPALREAGLRFRAVEIDALSTTPVIQDLVALTRALLHPADRIAWLAVLRAPWCGLSLAELEALTAGAPHGAIWPRLRGRQNVARIAAVFETALRHRPASLRDWVESVWMALGGPACAATATGLENAAAFFDLLDELDDGGALRPGALSERIAQLYAQPDSLADESLQLMTIHKAKGLEFDVVIVPGLGRRTRSDEVRLLLAMERPRWSGESDLLLAPVRATGTKEDRTYEYLKLTEKRRSEFEAGRLLYVAATRAKSELHLLGHVACDEKNGQMEMKAPEASSLLRCLWTYAAPVFQKAFAERPATAPAAVAAAAREPQRLTRFTAAWRLPLPPPDAGVPAIAEERGSASVSFRWAGDTLRHAGTVVHGMLRRIAEEGVEHWSAERIRAREAACRAALVSLGVPAAELATAMDRVVGALTSVLACDRGRWILGRHAESACELALCGVIEGEIVSVRIDRTFVDESGTRWIVDYKTSAHEGTGLDQFLDREAGRYGAQLALYRRLYAALDARPIRTALYFPLLNAWKEVVPAPSAHGAIRAADVV